MARFPLSPDRSGFKLVLLSTSLLLSEASSIAPVLPALAGAFPGVDMTTLQSFVTIGAAAGIVATLVSGATAATLGKRRLMLVGLLIVGLAGIAPMALISGENFTLLLLSRLALGAGTGLMQPLTASIVADFYQGKSRQNMLGWQSSMVGLGGTIWTFLVGVLLLIDWKLSFLIYAAAFVVFIFVWRYIPEPPLTDQQGAAAAEGGVAARAQFSLRLPASVWTAAALVAVITIGFNALFISAPLSLVAERHLLAPTDIALVLTVFSVTSIVAGVVFGPVVRGLHGWTAALSAAALGSGLLLVAIAGAIPVVYAGAILVGWGFGTFMPFLITEVNNRVSPNLSGLATAVFFTGAAVGTTTAPYGLNGIAKAFGHSDATTQMLVGFGIAMLIAVVAAVVYGFGRRPAPVQLEDQTEVEAK